MSDTSNEHAPPPEAELRRPRFSYVWLIPVIAAILAIYLGYRTISERGPLLQLILASADGLTAAQTQVKLKNVALGTVEEIKLSDDNRHVIVEVRMNNIGARLLTSHARFWVVRPNFSGGNISGLETLISGAYIAVDPGPPGGSRQTRFVGLEQPPGVRSDEPGTTYTLKASSIGSLGSGSPVFYRDVDVGEVLGYDIGNGLGPVIISVFVRSPFDRLVRPESHFWNSSGISASLENGVFQVQFQSLQAIVSGGVTFDLPREAENAAPSPSNSIFWLYPSKSAAKAAGYLKKIQMVTYFESSVGGLAPGAPVNVLGIQVGQVKDVSLIVDPIKGITKVRVAFELQPERIFKTRILPQGITLEEGAQDLLNHGLRVGLSTANYVTGEQVLTLSLVPNASVVTVQKEGDAFVIPSQPGTFETLMASLSIVSNKLEKIPLDQIGDNLNKLIVTTNNTLGKAKISQALGSLTDTLNVTTSTLKSLNQSYGGDSEFQLSLEQLMGQANNTLRSVDLLASYLNRHPEALLRGRGGQ